MENKFFNLKWPFILVILLIELLLKGHIQFYAIVTALIITIPYFIVKTIKTLKENSKERTSILINMVMILIFLIIGNIVISEKFKI